MSSHVAVKTMEKLILTPVSSGILQRACICGNHTTSNGGGCEECRRKREGMLQRYGTSNAPVSEVPPIVYEVLRSPGQPLDIQTRAFLEPRFGHEFSNVRVHTDAQAAESARKIHARAYTVGHNIVFGYGQYEPTTAIGERLLAHELTHTVQQQHAFHEKTVTGLTWIGSGATQEQQAEHAADRIISGYKPPHPSLGPIAIARQDLDAGIEGPRDASSPGGVSDAPIQRDLPLQRLPQQTSSESAVLAPILPGYSQRGDTCGAASLVTALIVWDRQNYDPASPNHITVTACNLILTYLAGNRSRTVESWNRRQMDGQALYEATVRAVTAVRDHARQVGARVTESEYQSLGVALWLLFSEGAGMSAAAIWNMQNLLGLGVASGGSESSETFEGMFTSSILRGLRPGQIAQLGWYARTGPPNAARQVNLALHAFLIGRFQDGQWFFSDQGPSPSVERIAPDLDSLRALINVAISDGQTMIFPSRPTTMVVGGWTGVRLIGDRSGVEARAQALIPTGTFLAEVDAGAGTWGEHIVSGAFVGRFYRLPDAQAAVSGFGAVIIEMPNGVFSVYRTNSVSESNWGVIGIDAEDSTGGWLTGHRYFHAWLGLHATGRSSRLIMVY